MSGNFILKSFLKPPLDFHPPANQNSVAIATEVPKSTEEGNRFASLWQTGTASKVPGINLWCSGGSQGFGLCDLGGIEAASSHFFTGPPFRWWWVDLENQQWSLGDLGFSASHFLGNHWSLNRCKKLPESMVKNEHEHVQNDFMNIFTFLAHFGWLFFYKKKIHYCATPHIFFRSCSTCDFGAKEFSRRLALDLTKELFFFKHWI